MHGVLPFRIAADGASLFQVAVGALIIVFGLAMFGWGMQTFARERTGIMPQKPASHVVVSGPYRWTRNPMYVGFTAIYAGFGVALNQVWPLVLLPIVLVVLFLAVIRREERYMRATFGPAYDDYCRRVPRWL
jgi:protein-S-isoprenylcysteine O-methyltransferase Ste14